MHLTKADKSVAKNIDKKVYYSSDTENVTVFSDLDTTGFPLMVAGFHLSALAKKRSTSAPVP